MKRSEIIIQARKHLGTKYVHQGNLPYVAEDCGNLIAIVCNELNYEVDLPTVYERTPNFLMFKKVVEEYMLEVSLDEIIEGDCLVFAFRAEPQHIAFISSVKPLHIIHASSELGKVVEQGIKQEWKRRLKAYRFKNLIEE